MSEIKVKKSGFNIIDALLIVIVLGAVGVLTYVLSGVGASGGSVDVIYTVEIPIIQNAIAEQAMKYKEGDVVIDTVKSFTIGEVISFTKEDAYQAVTDLKTGVSTMQKYPDHSKIVMTVRATCTMENDAYMIKGYRIGVGTQVHFRTPSIINYGYCTSLSEVAPESRAATEQQITAEQ